MKKHACKSCKYYYEWKAKLYKEIYNPLIDKYVNEQYSVEYKPCCGYTPTGVELDKERPICSNYEEKK